MDALIQNFHLDWKLLLAQMLNFGIVVLVLYKAAYKPLLKQMNERTGKIEKGLKDAQRAGQELIEAQKMRDAEIKKAKKESRELIAEAQKQAELNREETIIRAKEEAQKVIDKAKEQIREEKEKMLRELKSEVGVLVIEASKKVLEREISAKDEEKMIREVLG